jgi:uncharacterized membrane protein YdcZ (DUF606 family)
MRIDFDNLTKKQAWWFGVGGVLGGLVTYPVFHALVYHPDYDVVVNLALLFIGLIGSCLLVGYVRRLEKRMRASRARLTKLIGTEGGQNLYAQLPEAMKMKIDKLIAAKDREHEQNLK